MKKITSPLGLILLLGLIIRLYFSWGHYHPDLGNHLDWGNRLWEYGPKNFYTASVWSVSWPNQPPGTMYLWGVTSFVNRLIQNTAWQANLSIPLFPSKLIPILENRLHPFLVKIPSVLADLGISVLIYRIIYNWYGKKKALLASALFIFNPVVIYNSSVWGQTDSLVNFFGLLSLFYLLQNKFFLSILLFFISLYCKFSLSILLPLFVVLWLKNGLKPAQLAVYFLVCFTSLTIISLPFASGNPILWLASLYQSRIIGGQGNMLTGNAFNLWAMPFGIDFSIPDTGLFLGITYKIWGCILFSVAYLSVLFPYWRRKKTGPSDVFAIALVGFAAFLFLTNMHERYLYPVLPYLVILIFYRRPVGYLYTIISLVHLLNLYHLWYYPGIEVLKHLFANQHALLPARIFSLILFGCFFVLLSLYYHKPPNISTNTKND